MAEAPREQGKKFSRHIELRWSDQDANGHVNNARAITLVEEARVRAALQWTGTIPNGARPRVVRSLNVDFFRPVNYGPELWAHVWISRIGSTSYTVHHELHQHGKACVVAETVIVQLNPDTQKPEPLDDHMRQALGAALITPQN
ncbi:acyl-CoA thioesterase [Kocuria sp. cx-116]|uniref:acyl-CoA thioesterase n=1 Tax=Kocuria sp. cx-116 TaxID=2771378 RepID=UPI001683CCEB|nr:thioesterase family protein [Kocuria sp. cx-116]MBD2762243.1 acyl-CoA thioesterase [Kocuria sp. cx-116]